MKKHHHVVWECDSCHTRTAGIIDEDGDFIPNVELGRGRFTAGGCPCCGDIIGRALTDDELDIGWVEMDPDGNIVIS